MKDSYEGYGLSGYFATQECFCILVANAIE
uniref:Uncharacterized protein n=1 Tax=Anguilla anguilla TaxID=7936 RepID=A0A0E9UCS8_ANGAN